MFRTNRAWARVPPRRRRRERAERRASIGRRAHRAAPRRPSICSPQRPCVTAAGWGDSERRHIGLVRPRPCPRPRALILACARMPWWSWVSAAPYRCAVAYGRPADSHYQVRVYVLRLLHAAGRGTLFSVECERFHFAHATTRPGATAVRSGARESRGPDTGTGTENPRELSNARINIRRDAGVHQDAWRAASFFCSFLSSFVFSSVLTTAVSQIRSSGRAVAHVSCNAKVNRTR